MPGLSSRYTHSPTGNTVEIIEHSVMQMAVEFGVDAGLIWGLLQAGVLQKAISPQDSAAMTAAKLSAIFSLLQQAKVFAATRGLTVPGYLAGRGGGY